MNQQVMMRKLMKMKQEMEETQEEIQETEFEASSSGIVKVTVMGTKEIASIEIDESFEVESKEDLEMLSQKAMEDPCMPGNPREVTKEIFMDLYRQAM